jgi:hypothetical protein
VGKGRGEPCWVFRSRAILRAFDAYFPITLQKTRSRKLIAFFGSRGVISSKKFWRRRGFVSRDRQGVLSIGARADRSEPGMKTFIRIAEIWVPTKDRTQLEFGDGLYGPLGEFRSASQGMRFGFDEGLPGWAWSAGHPVIMTKFEDSHFKPGAAAKAAGLTCGVAMPIFAGDFLLAVMVLFCGGGDAHIGAIELWHGDLDESYDLRLADGYSVPPTCSSSTRGTPNSPAATGFRDGPGRPICRRSRRICSTPNPFCDRNRRWR